MSDAWALANCLLEDDSVAPASTPSPEEIDRIDDPDAYILKRFDDYYFQFDNQLSGRLKKKLEHNTYLIRNPNGVITVRLHNTNIMTVFPDNRVVVDTRGTGADKYLGAQHNWTHYGQEQSWHTPTTLDRLNRFLPGKWRLYGKKPRDEHHTQWNWFWYDSSGQNRGHNLPYTDGDFIDGGGELHAQQRNK